MEKLRDNLGHQSANCHREHRDTLGLVHTNAEHIAALIAHSESHQQRLHELTVKIDRLVNSRNT